MDLRALFSEVSRRYFADASVERIWQTEDRHALAVVQSDGVRYVLKSPYPYSHSAYYSRSQRSLNATALFLEERSARGLPVITYLPNLAGERVTCLPGGRYCYLTRYIDHEEGASVTREQFLGLAPVQAEMHLCAEALRLPRIRRAFLTEIDFASNLRRLSELSTGFSRSLLAHGLVELEFLRAAWQTLPTGLCHNDFGFCNVLVDRDGALTVIDFDFSQRNLYACELEGTIHSLCAGVAPYLHDTWAGPYLRDYERVRPLSEGERRVIAAGLTYAGYTMYLYTQGRWTEEQMAAQIRAYRAVGLPAGPDDIG